MEKEWNVEYLVTVGVLVFPNQFEFKQITPFFLGLILGECAIGGGWLIFGVTSSVLAYRFW